MLPAAHSTHTNQRQTQAAAVNDVTCCRHKLKSCCPYGGPTHATCGAVRPQCWGAIRVDHRPGSRQAVQAERQTGVGSCLAEHSTSSCCYDASVPKVLLPVSCCPTRPSMPNKPWTKPLTQHTCCPTLHHNQPRKSPPHLLRPLMPATAFTPAAAAAVSTASSCCRESNAPTFMIRRVEGPRADTKADVSSDTCSTGADHHSKPQHSTAQVQDAAKRQPAEQKRQSVHRLSCSCTRRNLTGLPHAASVCPACLHSLSALTCPDLLCVCVERSLALAHIGTRQVGLYQLSTWHNVCDSMRGTGRQPQAQPGVTVHARSRQEGGTPALSVGGVLIQPFMFLLHMHFC
jgi:hypothetical protein